MKEFKKVGNQLIDLWPVDRRLFCQDIGNMLAEGRVVGRQPEHRLDMIFNLLKMHSLLVHELINNKLVIIIVIVIVIIHRHAQSIEFNVLAREAIEQCFEYIKRFGSLALGDLMRGTLDSHEVHAGHYCVETDVLVLEDDRGAEVRSKGTIGWGL